MTGSRTISAISARMKLTLRWSHSGLEDSATAPRLQSRYWGRGSGDSRPVTAGIEGLLLRIPGIAIPMGALDERKKLSDRNRQKRIPLRRACVPMAKRPSQISLTHAERDPCDATHDTSLHTVLSSAADAWLGDVTP